MKNGYLKVTVRIILNIRLSSCRRIVAGSQTHFMSDHNPKFSGRGYVFSGYFDFLYSLFYRQFNLLKKFNQTCVSQTSNHRDSGKC